MILSLGLVLLFLFHRSFEKGEALFSNDGPLAVQAAASYHLPGAFLAIWNDLYWLGAHTGNFSPNITGLILLVLGPYGYTNFHIAVAVCILALCAWFYFRVLGFGSIACVLGGLAAAFNMNFFSNAAWGLSSRSLSLGMTFLALAALHSSFRSHALLKTMLAGLAVGMSISEGGDNGAIFSLFVAGYGFCLALFHFQTQPLPGRVGHGLWRVSLTAVCAAVLAVQTLSLFVDVAVKGIVGTQQDSQTKEQRWDWATQWSLPKLETTRVLIPGLFGYRMDTPEGGQYWGSVGQSAGWKPGAPLMARYSGAGEYAGVLVVLVALWTLAQAARRDKSVFDPTQRKLIGFWGTAALVALVLGWGRYAPLYQFLYALPYFSTIRNPMKFMHAFHLTVLVLFGYGVQGLFQLYLQQAPAKLQSLPEHWKAFWRSAVPFERRWTVASLAGLGAAALVYLIYSTSRPSLVRHLVQVGFEEVEAIDIARFSAGELGWFVVFLALSVGALLLVHSRWLAGRHARWAGLILGVILVVDLTRANVPWVIYYNYQQRYATNPVIDVLKDKPHEHRVAVVPFQNIPQLGQLQQFYHVEWLQHHFQYYNIQAIDVAQEPRLPADKEALLKAVTGHLPRYWELTGVRYLIGLAGGFADAMNQQLAPTTRPFREHSAFTIQPGAGGHFTVRLTNAGPFALIEMTNALPRAQFYTQWEVQTNQEATLQRLVSPEFNPARSVLVADPIPAAPPATNAAAAPPVQFVSYSPRKIVLRVNAPAAGILLLNDRYHPSWTVRVDDQPGELLRCNFVMRGVQVPAGDHTVTFRFAPRATTFYVTLTAVIAGLALCGLLALLEFRRPAPPAGSS